jgi:Mg/Co/Ni transporter MgtE (contains CBS domain)
MSPAHDIVEFFTQIENNIKTVIREDTPEGQELWKKLLLQHPADIAQLLEKLGTSKQRQVFKKLPRPIASEVFQELPEMIQVPLLKTMTLEETTAIFNQMSSDQLTDLFGHLTEEDLKITLN